MPRYDDHDESDDSLTRSYEPRLPRKPRPAVTHSSSYDSKRSPRRYASPQREPRRSRRVRGESHPRKPQNAAHEERSRNERRLSRRTRDPDGHDRRRQRSARDAGRERNREERAARDPDYAARKERRRASRRAERRASMSVEQWQRRSAPATDRVSNDSADGHDHEDRAGELDAPALPPSTTPDTPPLYSAPDPDHHPQEQDRDYRQSYPSRQHKGRRSRPEPARYTSRRLARNGSWDDWDVDLENPPIDDDEKKRPYSQSNSTFSELQWYKRGTIQDGRHYYRHDERRGCCGFGRKCTIVSSILVALVVLIIIIVVAVVVSKKNKFSYTPSTLQVNETAAFVSGAATRNSVNDTKDGIGAGTDTYTYYQGNATKFLADVPSSKWVSFEDMWTNNLETFQNACGWLDYGENNSPEEIQHIYNAIQDRARASLVDHRLILAFILQESKGCIHTPPTKSSGGVHNTGLMQAHHGHEYEPKRSYDSILTMVQDGVQGTKKGNGLVQELNAYYGNPYAAARAYNSGYIPQSGELTDAAGATECYVSDVANRLTGWVKAQSTCSDSGH